MEGNDDKNASIRGLAMRQHGVVARSQLIAIGVGTGQIESWVATHRLIRVFRGVYALGRPVDRFEMLAMAGALYAGPAAAVSGRSAAALWGMSKPVERIDLIRPVGRALSCSGFPPHGRFRLSVRRSPLDEGDITRRGSIPVLSVPRLLIDLAGRVSHRELRRNFIEAGRSGLLTPDCLDRFACCGTSFKGNGRLAELIDSWIPETGLIRSSLEGEFLMLCGKHGIPQPLTNKRVEGYEVDCLWPKPRLVVELDGRQFHSDGFAHENDRVKGNKLVGAGYTLLRFTYDMVTGRPHDVVAAVKAELAVS